MSINLSAWLLEVVEFISDLADGKLDLDDARKRAKKIRDSAPENAAAEALDAINKRIAELEAE